mmetsp:Transcript_38558/g.69974  ORF Transcript_38558/g.69974 Transcript_38558/m.69974 type:complete len:243 (+) Transcript_38558:314-1042(+)
MSSVVGSMPASRIAMAMRLSPRSRSSPTSKLASPDSLPQEVLASPVPQRGSSASFADSPSVDAGSSTSAVYGLAVLGLDGTPSSEPSCASFPAELTDLPIISAAALSAQSSFSRSISAIMLSKLETTPSAGLGDAALSIADSKAPALLEAGLSRPLKAREDPALLGDAGGRRRGEAARCPEAAKTSLGGVGGCAKGLLLDPLRKRWSSVSSFLRGVLCVCAFAAPGLCERAPALEPSSALRM